MKICGLYHDSGGILCDCCFDFDSPSLKLLKYRQVWKIDYDW